MIAARRSRRTPGPVSTTENRARPLRRAEKGGKRAGLPRTVRILWEEGRVLIYASPGDIRFVHDATIRFTLAQREALAPEARMKSAWASIENDFALTHSVSPPAETATARQ
jgi:hypothetical protein